MERNINTILDVMVDHLLTLNHLKETGHDTLEVTLDYIWNNAVEVITMVGTINSDNIEVGHAEWYALLRDTRDLSAEVDAQVKAVEALNNALTLSA